MLLTNSAAVFALVGLAAAAPAKQEPRVLSHDDIIVVRSDGGYEVMKDWQVSDLERRMEKEQRDRADEERRRALAGETVPLGARSTEPEAGIERRCDTTDEIQVLTDTQFTNWDVEMSPVIGATSGAQANVAVTKGYTIANTFTLGGSLDATFKKDVFSASLSLDYNHGWSTTDSQSFTYFVAPGQYGIVVSNPYTRRITGNSVMGCVDSPTYKPFVSDSYTPQEYSNMKWVQGTIKLCNNTIYPIPFCTGSGEHL